jgi:hypothetical protein
MEEFVCDRSANEFNVGEVKSTIPTCTRLFH